MLVPILYVYVMGMIVVLLGPSGDLTRGNDFKASSKGYSFNMQVSLCANFSFG